MSLDAFKPAHPLLERKFHLFMRALELGSDGKIASRGDKVSGDHEGNAPQSALEQDLRHWEREWRQRRTDRARLELLVEIQREVTQMRYAPNTTSRPGTLEWKQDIAHDDREPTEVCDTYGISRATYYRIRGLNLTRPRRRLF